MLKRKIEKEIKEWISKAGVTLPTFNVTEPTVPLLLNEKSTLFKLFLSDIGLLTTIYGKATKLKILNRKTDINKGAIYENVVAQELKAHGFSLYYYNNKKRGELDFVIERSGTVLPIEVKSGKDYEKHSALTQILSAGEYDIEDAAASAFHQGKPWEHMPTTLETASVAVRQCKSINASDGGEIVAPFAAENDILKRADQNDQVQFIHVKTKKATGGANDRD
ncbi:MAG: DUF4143 domain-containing protein [Lachnospiraceae bacterium]|nr:DUF4143 domain-containing protein [Lachnospiraceae bacterium]